MNNKLFDDGYFATRAEGNLPFAPDSFLKSPAIKRAGDSWVRPFVNRASLMTPRMNAMSCPAPTLNSFAAFADSANFDPLTDTPGQYQDYGPTMAQAGFTPQATVVQPASVKGNGILDAISGVIKDLTPVAGSAITSATQGQSTSSQQQLLKQYLAGKLPNMMLNAQGQVVPKTAASTGMNMATIGPIIGLGVAGLILVLVMNRK